MLAATLSAVGSVPVGGLALILGIDRFMSEARAITNVIGNGVAAIVVAKWTGDLDTGMLASRLRCSEPTLLAAEMSPVYLGVVSPLGNIFEDLKSLPPERLEAAADFIRRLKPESQLERQTALDRTLGCLSQKEDGEKIDERRKSS